LACTGTYLTDLPEAFEKGSLFHSSVKGWGGGPLTPSGDMCLARTINWAAFTQYGPVPEDAEVGWGAAFDEYANCKMSCRDRDRFLHLRTAVLAVLAARW